MKGKQERSTEGKIRKECNEKQEKNEREVKRRIGSRE